MSVIDDSGNIPKLKNRRVTIFDVMLTINVNSNPEKQFKEAWDLNDQQIKDVREYIDNNKEHLKKIEANYYE